MYLPMFHGKCMKGNMYLPMWNGKCIKFYKRKYENLTIKQETISEPTTGLKKYDTQKLNEIMTQAIPNYPNTSGTMWSK